MDEIKTLIEALQESLHTGELQNIVSHFHLPVVAYLPTGLTIIRDEKALIEAAKVYRDLIVSLNSAYSEVTVSDYEELKEDRAQATVHVTEFDASGVPVHQNTVRYFFIFINSQPAIEMLEQFEVPTHVGDNQNIVH